MQDGSPKLLDLNIPPDTYKKMSTDKNVKLLDLNIPPDKYKASLNQQNPAVSTGDTLGKNKFTPPNPQTTNNQPKKQSSELMDILSQPGQKLDKAIGEFKQAFTGSNVGKGVGNYLSGVVDIGNAGLSTIGSLFGVADYGLRQLPGGEGVSNVINTPFNAVGQGVQAGENALDKLGQGLPQNVKNLGLPQKQADQLSQSMSGLNQGLAQLLLAHGLDAGYKGLMPEKYSPIVKLSKDRLTELKNQKPDVQPNEVPPKDVSNVAQVGPEGTGVEKLTDLQPENKPNAEVDKEFDKHNTEKEAADHLIETPLHLLPDEIKSKIQNEAEDLIGELKNATVERTGLSHFKEMGTSGEENITRGKKTTTNFFPDWFRLIPGDKSVILNALQKILEDEGKDKGVTVERAKAVILDHLQNGRELRTPDMIVSGVTKRGDIIGEVPPDEAINDFLGQFADKKVTLEDIHSAYNEFKQQEQFSFGANAEPVKVSEPVMETSEVKPGEQMKMQGLGEAKMPEGFINRKGGKGEETTPLFNQKTEDKSQENLFGDNGQVLASRLPYINEFVNNSLSPIVKDLIKGGKNTIKGFVNLVAPTFGVDREARTIVDKTLGDQNKAATILDRASSEWENMLGKMNQHDQVAFIDRYKRGLPQQNEHLQLIADYIKGVDKTVYDELQKHNPSINWKENHLRVMWKKIPGAETEQGGFKGLFRRPLQGTKGMFKHSTLEDMSEGIQKGGIPYSYNPLTNFKASYADAYKFITANRMWDAAKDLGLRVFVRHGKDIPDGFVKLNDGIAKVYFKSKIDKVMTSPGEWYVDEGFGRLLNNHLSTDLIRTSDFGKGMMWIKNAYTATELSFSPYHFSFVSIASMAHQLGLGYQKILSSSLFVGDFGRVGQGIKDVLTSPAAPKIDYNIGRDALRLLTEDGFKNSEAGKSLLKQFPEAGHLIDLGFENGLTAKLQDEYKNKSVNAFKQAWNNQDPMGAMLFHALPSLNQIVMAPLFDHFIPNIKWGAFLKGLSDDLVTHAEDLKSGKITESQLASKNVTHVEDIFGEKNFDRFYWNRTFKSALQLLFRSVTWKQGTLHLFASAPFEQGKEFYDAAKEGRAPRLNRNLAFVLGLATIHTAMANAIQLAFGQGPTTSFKDLVAPKINKDGSRIQIMDYFKDAMSFAKNQVNYLTSSTSGEIGKLMELWQNKDFYGYEVYDPNAPISMETWQAALHMAPLPFGVQQYLKTSGKPIEERASGLLGFNKAPKYITNTSAQNDIDELYDKRFGGGTKPYSQREIDQAKTDLRNLKKQNSPQFEDKLNDYVNKGLIDLKSNFVKELDKNSDVPQDVKMFQRLPAVDQGGVLKDHPEDIQKYLPYAQTDLFKNNPEFLDQLKPIMENLPAKQRVSLQRRIYKKIGRVIE
jgi:hypothetical protein